MATTGGNIMASTAPASVVFEKGLHHPMTGLLAESMVAVPNEGVGDDATQRNGKKGQKSRFRTGVHTHPFANHDVKKQ